MILFQSGVQKVSIKKRALDKYLVLMMTLSSTGLQRTVILGHFVFSVQVSSHSVLSNITAVYKALSYHPCRYLDRFIER